MTDQRKDYWSRVISTLNGLDHNHHHGEYFGQEDIRLYCAHELPNGPRLKILLEDMAQEMHIEQATVHLNRDIRKVYRARQPSS